MVVLAGSASRLANQTARPLHIGSGAIGENIAINGVIGQGERITAFDLLYSRA